jgi:hypothetical protein
MEESPLGAEGDGVLPLRAGDVGLVSLSSVGGSAGSSLGGTDWDTSEAAVVAIESFADDPNNMNQAISRAKNRDMGSSDTGSAEDGGTDTGSADAGRA